MSFLTKNSYIVFIGMQLIVYWILLRTGISGDFMRLFVAGLIAFVILLGVTVYLARAEGTLDRNAEDAGTHRLRRFLSIYLFPLVLIATDGLYLTLEAAGMQGTLTMLLVSTAIVLAIALPIAIKLRKKLRLAS